MAQAKKTKGQRLWLSAHIVELLIKMGVDTESPGEIQAYMEGLVSDRYFGGGRSLTAPPSGNEPPFPESQDKREIDVVDLEAVTPDDIEF